MSTKEVEYSKFFDLEQQIMDCWSLTETLMRISKSIPEGYATEGIEDISKLLSSTADLYNFQFEYLFKTYENMLKS